MTNVPATSGVEAVEDEVMTNGFLESPSESKENVYMNGVVEVSERIKRRAKRPSKFMPKDLHRANSDSQVVAPLRALKNSRRPRCGFSRGLTKKGGAGGKGTWGALGSEIVEEGTNASTLDPKDPNYDEYSSDSKNVRLKVVRVLKSDEELKKELASLVAEYFDHGDTHEAYLSFDELSLDSRSYFLVVTAIETAMDHKPSHREMTSFLLADLYGHLLSENDYTKGYDILLNDLRDLTLDTPDAASILGNFIARSIADDCIPPKFLQSYKGKAESEYAVQALSRADSLLSMRHGLVRLDNVWGVGGGTRPVKYLINKMILLLEEYLSSSDIKEATRCLVDLEVPHFHHELVYEAVMMAIDKMNDRTINMMCDLLASLYNAVIVTPNQMREGFLRIYEDMPEISLDAPAAYFILEKLLLRCQAAKIVTDEIVKKLPVRGRKRFVSEGDGGKVKEHPYF